MFSASRPFGIGSAKPNEAEIYLCIERISYLDFLKARKYSSCRESEIIECPDIVLGPSFVLILNDIKGRDRLFKDLRIPHFL